LRCDFPGRDFDGPFISQIDRPKGFRDVVRHWVSLTYVEMGEFQAGMRLIQEWFQEIDPVDNALGTSRLTVYLALGRLHNAMGNFDDAVVAYETALANYREDWHGPYSRPVNWGLGLAYALAGHVSRELDVLESAEAAERKIGSKTWFEMLRLYLARAYVKAGRLDDAARCANEALTGVSDHPDMMAEAGAHSLLGEIAKLREPLPQEEMERHLMKALALSDALGLRPVAAPSQPGVVIRKNRPGGPRLPRQSRASLLEAMGNPRSLDAAGVH
jgi:tetratricopeptide (TPR) repeat protein